jgi:hypothetical protein
MAACHQLSASADVDLNVPFSCAYCGDSTLGFPFGRCTTCPGGLLCEPCLRRHTLGRGLAAGHDFTQICDDDRSRARESLSLGLAPSICTPHALEAVRQCLTCMTLLCESCAADHVAHVTTTLREAACAARTRLRVASAEAAFQRGLGPGTSVIDAAQQTAQKISAALDVIAGNAAAAQAQADNNRDAIIAAASASHAELTEAISHATVKTRHALELELVAADGVLKNVRKAERGG